jgi:protein-S-isoprenylcysteine O-methyltransferase Ste14
MKIRHLKTLGLIIGMVLVVLIAKPTFMSLVIGGIIVSVGELIRMWAAGHLKRNNELATSGPYAYLRDPLYLGRFFLIIGFCIMAWGYGLLLLPFALGIFFMSYMPRKHKKEMARLEGYFGEKYVKYAASVRSLIPRLTPYPEASKNKWNFDVFWRVNREQYFILIMMAIFLSLIFRFNIK